MADSDDDFSAGVQIQESIPKKSKLSKKKNKENVKKPHTSTQKDVPEPITARGGRPARKTAEELQFQRELEEALRISSTDVSSSSAEIVAVNRDEMGVKKDEKERDDLKMTGAVDEILVVSDSSQESVGQTCIGLSSAGKEDLNNVVDNQEVKEIFKKKRKCGVIESDDDDEFETEISKPIVKKQRDNPVSEKSKKKKIDESWVVSGRKKTNDNGAQEHKITLKREVRPKKYSGDSSESENFSEDTGGEESDDEFEPIKHTRKKTPVKKVTSKKTPLKKSVQNNPISSGESNISPKKPLAHHNPSPCSSIPQPKSNNMFQNKSPVKHSINPKSPVPAQQPTKPGPAPSFKSLTPGPSHSISSLLKQFQSQNKSTPIMGLKPKSDPPQSPAPSTPLQKKLPCWTPPARVGTPGSKSLTPGHSPAIGLRVGLSRNFKSKPLHSGVKYP